MNIAINDNIDILTYHALRIIARYTNGGSKGSWRGDAEGHYCTFITSLLRESVEQKAGGPGNTKVCSFHRCMKIVNDKMLNKNLATSFTSTLPLVLLPAIQKSSLSLDAISKSFYYTNIGNFNIRYYYIINLNGFINYEKYTKNCPFKILIPTYDIMNTIS